MHADILGLTLSDSAALLRSSTPSGAASTNCTNFFVKSPNELSYLFPAQNSRKCRDCEDVVAHSSQRPLWALHMHDGIQSPLQCMSRPMGCRVRYECPKASRSSHLRSAQVWWQETWHCLHEPWIAAWSCVLRQHPQTWIPTSHPRVPRSLTLHGMRNHCHATFPCSCGPCWDWQVWSLLRQTPGLWTDITGAVFRILAV